MIRILTMTTAAHQYFIKTLQSEVSLHCKMDMTVIPLDDECEGDFHSINFFNACYNKICIIINELSMGQTGDILIYLDADICVRGDIVSAMINELGDNHVAFQRDNNTYCAGMFICKVCPEILNFFKTVQNTLSNNKEYYLDSVNMHDQGAINTLLLDSKLNYLFLSDRFTTYGNIAGELWTQSSPEFKLNDNVFAFHANWTVGLENKTALLAQIRSTAI